MPYTTVNGVIPIILFASDLDNTLIHSYKRALETDVCVEFKEEKALSYMTPKALELLRSINERDDIVFSPFTTRSTEQYERIHFFGDSSPEIALAANGGILYIDGRKNEEWFDESKKMTENCRSEFKKGITLLSEDENVCFEIRVVDDLFVFTKSSDPLETKAMLDENLDCSLVTNYNIGSKVYIFPEILTKGNALERLKRKFDFEKVICAGDSEFDVSMLDLADTALCPYSLKKMVSAPECVGFDIQDSNFAEQFLEYISLNF